MHEEREPLTNPQPNLMRVHRKRGHPEESRRDENNVKIRNSEEYLLLEKTDVSMVSTDHESFEPVYTSALVFLELLDDRNLVYVYERLKEILSVL